MLLDLRETRKSLEVGERLKHLARNLEKQNINSMEIILTKI
jgi:hypothetical protein